MAAGEAAEDDAAIQRFANLPRDVGWMMVSVGVLGVIVPGLPGGSVLVRRDCHARTGRTKAFGALG